MPSESSTAKNASPATQALKNELSNFTWPREGLVVDAAFVSKESRTAYFDLGKFGTGVVYGAEFVDAKDIIRDLKTGDIISAKIVALDGEGGHIELSLTEASRQKVWQQVAEFQESGDIITVKPTGVNQGGLTANVFDLKGFLPISQLSPEHYPKDLETDRQKGLEELKNLVGQELSVKVISVNPKKNKLILSERDTVAVNMKELLGQYAAGQVVDGIVSGIADFGIFVRFADNPQVEGLVHISEIDHRLIDNPKETVAMNEAVKVKIIDIRDGRVFLSLKALKADPWATVGERYQEGEEVAGRVHKYNPFGAVVNLDGGVQGLIHVSEFGGVEEMKKAIQPGETYSFVIASLKPEEKRLILKMKK